MLALQPEAARHPLALSRSAPVLTRISANCDQKSQLKVPATNSQFTHLVQGMKQVLRVQQYPVASSSSRTCCCNRGSVRPDLSRIRYCAILGFTMPCEKVNPCFGLPQPKKRSFVPCAG